jgi:hypothetical protein
VGRLHAAERGSSVSFEYDAGWLQREDTFAIDPTSLPLQRGAHHGTTLFGAIQDCGSDRWGRVLIERAVWRWMMRRASVRYASALIPPAISRCHQRKAPAFGSTQRPFACHGRDS